MYEHTLKMMVEGMLTIVASNLDGRKLQPYVCMDDSESIALLNRTSYCDEICHLNQIIPSEDLQVGLDNGKWSNELDTALMQRASDIKHACASISDGQGHIFSGNICFLRLCSKMIQKIPFLS